MGFVTGLAAGVVAGVLLVLIGLAALGHGMDPAEDGPGDAGAVWHEDVIDRPDRGPA